MKIQTVYRIEDGILKDTEIEPISGFVGVKYPHRKSRDLYVPPMKTNEKEIKTWHCCQENCKSPDFEGNMDALLDHLLLHKGKLLKHWNKKNQLKSPMPAIKLPPNPWNNNSGCNADRRFCVQLYIDDVKRILRKQGIEVMELSL
jgi:hypothetical protein